ncbi:MAG: hypothetical protein KF689_09300 [Gemmatimonadaceae bacterium]|nr:hypothetical protein [Gemmatimonadaceae bacterium]MCW5826207.1 hypothetical protein [Gemmatimonadaceae bacterium]
MRRLLLVLAAVALSACGSDRAPAVADTSCFGTRVLSYRDLVAEVLIPAGESCESGSFVIVFTRGDDSLRTLVETRVGTVGFIGTADVDGDGRGEFFVATHGADAERRGTLFAYAEGTSGIERFPLASLADEQLEGYAGQDRFGFGGANQLVRAYPVGTAGDTAWFGYSHGEARWDRITRPSWVR